MHIWCLSLRSDVSSGLLPHLHEFQSVQGVSTWEAEMAVGQEAERVVGMVADRVEDCNRIIRRLDYIRCEREAGD